MKEVLFNVYYHQFSIEGQLEITEPVKRNFFDLFDRAVEEIGNGNMENTLANTVNTFCKKYASDLDVTSRMTEILVSAHLKRNPEALESDTVTINVSELLTAYNIDENALNRQFNIFVAKRGEIQEFNLDDFDHLPPEIQKLMEQAKESPDCIAAADYDPATGEIRMLSEEEMDDELTKGMTKSSIEEIERHIAKKSH
ncbi:hypothetical protein [Vibrio owensii]|uniref:hypothetical protein n=1 Tax=Vibrio owensii TaxID=696485 RepID=UPI0018F21145|nr:hypothetical protein [Vibrio owensii]